MILYRERNQVKDPFFEIEPGSRLGYDGTMKQDGMLTIGERHLYVLCALVLIGFLVVGVVVDGWWDTFDGLFKIQIHPARLLNDFTEVGGTGGALWNAALVAGIGLFIVGVSRVRLSGPTIAAFFTMLGFGLFGKTPVNIVPIIAGVAIAARIARKRFQEYILMALFGTALGPLIAAVAFEAGLPLGIALPVSCAAGVLAGILLPAAAISMLRLHQGFSLYNIGLTCGFLAVFAAALLVASGHPLDPGAIWNGEPDLALVLLAPGVSVLFMVFALLSGPRSAASGFVRILRLSGRLPSDFLTMTTIPGSLFNAGIMGLLTWGYVMVVGGPLNGPVLGGIFTAIGFATFGKHPKNSWSVVAGVVAGSLLFGRPLASSGPLLTALFVLTLAPLAGEFGWPMGILAGFLHLTLVLRTGSWHLGINLYNNGFAGGLTATLLVAVVQWYRSSRDTRESRREEPRQHERRGANE